MEENKQITREHFERMFGPGSWERMKENQRQRDEQMRKWEEERQRIRAREEEARKYREEMRRREYLHAHSMEEFMKEKPGFCFDPKGTIPSMVLYGLYETWCTDQNILPEAPRVLLGWLKEDGYTFSIRPCQNLITGDGRRVRGFRGIRLKTEEDA